MTGKFAQPRPTAASFGNISRRQQLSFDKGVIRSDGKTQASSAVVTCRRPPCFDIVQQPFGKGRLARAVRGFGAIQLAP